MKRVASLAVCLVGGALLFAQSRAQTEQMQQPPSGTPGLQRPSGPLIRICSAKTPPPCATPPRPLYTPDPEYSKEAHDAHYQGTSVLWLIVGTDGNAYDVRVVLGLGHGLDKKAVDAVKEWRFEPAREDGQPVAVQINVEVSFRVDANPPQIPATIVVSPRSTRVVAGAQEQFSAKVPGVSSPTLTWSVSGDGCEGPACGTIGADGLYTAPLTVPDFPTVIVTVTSVGDPVKTGLATVNLLPGSSR
jgi:TonB family protein